ncbi:MAG: hypothetical protein IJ011_03275 [Clostridia bacterium]|nr:hypothetical protein [Clostridia bacterium]
MRKKFKRLGATMLVLILCLGVFTLYGCNNDEPDVSDSESVSDTDTEADTSKTPIPETPTTLTPDMLSEMKIIYPARAGDALVEAVKNLKAAIDASYGVDILIISDYIPVLGATDLQAEVEYEILIGDTEREESSTGLSELRTLDYAYAMEGTKLLIKGGCEDKTVEAVTKFAYDIALMKKGGDELFYTTDWNYTYEYAYTARTLTLGGRSLLDCTIVYPKSGTAFEEQLANKLADHIEMLTGKVLPVEPDNKAEDADGEILIGDTSRTVGARTKDSSLLSDGKYLAIRGETPSDTADALVMLVDMIESEAKDTVCALTLSEELSASKKTAVSAMTYNVYGFEVVGTRVANTFVVINRCLPDIICFQEVEEKWAKRIKQEYSEYYEIVLGLARHGEVGSEEELKNAPGENTYLPILYNKARFDMKEWGTKWLTSTPDEVSLLDGAQYYRTYTWVVLTDKVTGEEFVVVNNHLDNGGSTVNNSVRVKEIKLLLQFLQESFTDIPVLLMGDMNCADGSEPIQLLTDVGVGSAHTYNDGLNSVKWTIDWIMGTTNSVTFTDYQLRDDVLDGTMPSDHPAVYAEFVIDVPEGGVTHKWTDGVSVGIPIKPDTEGSEYIPPIIFY